MKSNLAFFVLWSCDNHKEPTRRHGGWRAAGFGVGEWRARAGTRRGIECEISGGVFYWWCFPNQHNRTREGFLVKHVWWEAKRYKYPFSYLPFSFFSSWLLFAAHRFGFGFRSSIFCVLFIIFSGEYYRDFVFLSESTKNALPSLLSLCPCLAAHNFTPFLACAKLQLVPFVSFLGFLPLSLYFSFRVQKL